MTDQQGKPAIMAWSLRLARVAGIDIAVHATFALLLGWIALTVWRSTHSSAAVLQGLLFVLTLFACVVLHELGHALTARRFGIRTRSITLLPIGGVASMEKIPEDPKQEMLVAVAGPLVNVAIAVVIWLWLGLNNVAPPDPGQNAISMLGSPAAFLYSLLSINLMLAIFNMLPAFPMDGGRVLRAALATRMDHHLATLRAARIGQSMAVVLFFLGFFYSPILMLISVFIWLAAGAESGAEQLRHALHRVSTQQAMITRFDTLHVNDTLQRALDLTMHTDQKHYPVQDDYGTLKLLSQRDMLTALRQHGEQVRIGNLPLPTLECCELRQPMQQVLDQIQQQTTPVVGVTAQDKLVGLIHLENIMELLRIAEARAAHTERPPAT
ncbi:MAG: site-2 protease family protein [Alcanivoracaceae bacterium]|nr:site-2 protease family protein [Alcanivoracaceae bacterium]